MENNSDVKKDEDGYRKKYVSLKHKCESIQLDNEKCLNRLYYVKKAVRKMSRERRFLTTKLDKYGDNYKNATLTLPIEDDSMLQLLGINSPIAPSFPASRGLAGLVTKSQRSKSSRGRAGRVGRVGRPRLISEMTSHDNRPSGRGGKRKRMPSQNKQDKEKDPLAPKKPANAFLMFCQTERHTMQGESSSKDPEGGDMSHQELTRQLAKRWNYLEAGEKETYYTMYERDKDRYHKEMKEYIQSNNLDPPMVTNPTPQPQTDTVTATTRIGSVMNGQTIPKKEPVIIKSEPIPLSSYRSTSYGSPTSTPKTLTTTSTNSGMNRVKKPEVAVQVKKEVKMDSFPPKTKPILQLKPVLEGDDPYHFDDD
ncbi:uncharacterized protein LOC117292266 [Asterias rubens]|uniref:uncharacterized protein LOC117292266 n=1 Tax=Asterias rubens TaxID=7604 RepID=UPI001455798D|nr:uncharacterized protein LOC117292266 [Asterias rubens]